MATKNPIAVSVHWFRRDLRLDDNTALYHALLAKQDVLPLFIFDSSILNKLDNKRDARVSFIFNELQKIQTELSAKNTAIDIRIGSVMQIWKQLIKAYNISAVYTNTDYEPYARKRDSLVKHFLSENNIPFYSFKDHVVFERNEIVKRDGEPYRVFTPYSKIWKSNFNNTYKLLNNIVPNALSFDNWYEKKPTNLSIEDIGFQQNVSIPIPDKTISDDVILHYKSNRNYPYLKAGTSRLSVHLRFGTISLRKLLKQVINVRKHEALLNELIWREFYQMLLWHFPNVVTQNFKSKYNAIEWRNNEEEFNKWCEGKTGFPLVDAGMRQLNKIGFMHNRMRMLTASFLTKDLLIDWRWGEAYFANKLLDYELASNNGGWQWAAGTGADAAPYFRIFNPTTQIQKFDKDFNYIKQWVPEFGTEAYPKEMLDHKEARLRALEVYKTALQ